MSETPETKRANLAVQVLCNQFANKFVAEREELAKIAFQSDNVDPSEWAFDTFTGTYTKLAPQAQE